VSESGVVTREWRYGDKTVFYEGEVDQNSRPHGEGNLRVLWDDGNEAFYVGQFKDGLYHGRGQMTYAGGAVYEGDWVNHEKHGEGTYNFANEDIYVGQFKDDNFHGKGEFTFADGRWFEGEWNAGSLTNAKIFSAAGELVKTLGELRIRVVK
jgi:hypothetical protein